MVSGEKDKTCIVSMSKPGMWDTPMSDCNHNLQRPYPKSPKFPQIKCIVPMGKHSLHPCWIVTSKGEDTIQNS